jgi:hypothetical protein
LANSAGSPVAANGTITFKVGKNPVMYQKSYNVSKSDFKSNGETTGIIIPYPLNIGSINGTTLPDGDPENGMGGYWIEFDSLEPYSVTDTVEPLVDINKVLVQYDGYRLKENRSDVKIVLYPDSSYIDPFPCNIPDRCEGVMAYYVPHVKGATYRGPLVVLDGHLIDVPIEAINTTLTSRLVPVQQPAPYRSGALKNGTQIVLPPGADRFLPPGSVCYSTGEEGYSQCHSP